MREVVEGDTQIEVLPCGRVSEAEGGRRPGGRRTRERRATVRGAKLLAAGESERGMCNEVKTDTGGGACSNVQARGTSSSTYNAIRTAGASETERRAPLCSPSQRTDASSMT